MADSLQTYEILKTGNLPEDYARAVTLAIQRSEIDRSDDLKAFIREEFAILRREFDLKLSSLEVRLETRLNARIDVKIAEAKAELTRWMFLFWVGQIGIILAVMKYGK